MADVPVARTLLNRVITSGAGQAMSLNFGGDNNYIPAYHTATIESETTAGYLVVDIEGSLDNSAWFTLASYTMTGTVRAMIHIADKGVIYSRANLISMSPTVTVTVKMSSTR